MELFLYAKLNCLKYNCFICIKMDLALNNLQWLIYYKTKPSMFGWWLWIVSFSKCPKSLSEDVWVFLLFFLYLSQDGEDILAQVLSTISLVILGGCVRLLVAVSGIHIYLEWFLCLLATMNKITFNTNIDILNIQ